MKDLVFSGVQPTANIHIGNYIGALKQWVEIQKSHRCLFCIVDLHAITMPQDPKQLRSNIFDVAATYLAIGINPARSTIFIQSEVSEHCELGWILGTIAKMGEMERMTQFKDKTKKGGRERSGLGLFSYPALMAADILLYDASAVPVGEDQMQHIELTRILARRFNQQFGDTFTIPQALIQKHGARIMSLQDPSKKMSKSDESKSGVILLEDTADDIRKKIMRAVTDTKGGVSFDQDAKPAVSNLMTIYHHMSGLSLKEIETKYEGKGYGDFKKDLADVLIAHLEPIGKRMKELRSNPAELKRILDEGRDTAKSMAKKKMHVVKDRVGLGRK
jgi:tryptophanyl-tRNA synthetase